MDGDFAVVEPPGDDDHRVPNNGAVHVYHRDASGAWNQEAKLRPIPPDAGDRSSEAVAVSGDTVAVGAYGTDQAGPAFSGAVYVYRRDGAGNWNLEQFVTPIDPGPLVGPFGEQFGFAVELRGDRMVVGAPAWSKDGFSDILIEFVRGYVVGQGLPREEAGAWAADLLTLGAQDRCFYAGNEYYFLATKPRSERLIPRPEPGEGPILTMRTLLLLFILYAIALSVGLARAGHRSRPAAPPGGPRGRPTRVLIVGATGGTGRHLVAQALERGYTVTALAREPSRLQVRDPRLTVVRGDVLHGRSVEEAMRGQEAVLCALGHRRYFYPTRILSEGTRHILRTMETHGVARLVCETSLGIGDSAGRMGLYYTFLVIPVVLPFYFWDKTRQERLIAESGVEWVIVRPGVLTDGPRRERYRQGRRIGGFIGTVRISRADVAGFMLNQLESDSNIRTAPGVCW